MDHKWRLSGKAPSTLVYSASVDRNGLYKVAKGRHSKIKWAPRTKLSQANAIKQAQQQKEN